MKILGINGSPRGSKSETLNLVKAVLEGAKSRGFDVELVDVCKLNIEYCNACGICYRTGKCARKDDFQTLYEKMLNAEGLVLGSPNYLRSVTAQLKTLLDRMSDTIHCQLFAGKHSATVATAGGPGQDEGVREYLSHVLLSFGSFVTGSVGASLAAGPAALDDAERKAFQLGETLAEDIKTRKRYADQEPILSENRKYFQALVEWNKGDWIHEFEHWSRVGEGRG